MYRLKELFSTSSSAAEFISQFSRLTADIVHRLDSRAIADIATLIQDACSGGQSVFVIGNGGSAAVASHFVNDLGVNNFVPGQPGFRVFCLADNSASVTAVANDLSFEDVFLQQLRVALGEGDVVMAMSVSGNSENVLRAVQYANEHGAHTIGLCGFDGGRLAKSAQLVVHVESSADEYGPVEDAFSVICHAISGYLSMRRGRFLHH